MHSCSCCCECHTANMHAPCVTAEAQLSMTVQVQIQALAIKELRGMQKRFSPGVHSALAPRVWRRCLRPILSRLGWVRILTPTITNRLGLEVARMHLAASNFVSTPQCLRTRYWPARCLPRRWHRQKPHSRSDQPPPGFLLRQPRPEA